MTRCIGLGYEDGIVSGALLAKPLLAGRHRLVFLGPGHGRVRHRGVVERADGGGIVLVGVANPHRTLVSSRPAGLAWEVPRSSGGGFGHGGQRFGPG